MRARSWTSNSITFPMLQSLLRLNRLRLELFRICSVFFAAPCWWRPPAAQPCSATLRSATLRSAALRSADLSSAGLSSAGLSSAKRGGQLGLRPRTVPKRADPTRSLAQGASFC